jgi:peptide-methionine (S)-S-oxide reductase
MRLPPLVIGAAVLVLAATPSANEPHAARALTNAGRVARLDTAVLAGGCFWGVEAVFEHVKGVAEVVSGYAGGTRETADYDRVSSGLTGHAESVRITYDPAVVSYETLLEIFFLVAHDPTQLNRQGPDIGPQYRSVVFYADSIEARLTRQAIAALAKAGTYQQPIVTQVVPLEAFHPAESYHQDFAARNPDHPYIVYHDLPKVERLRTRYPKVYTRR